MNRVTRRFSIVGKVQGVYFRHSTRLEAQRLRLSGYARNMPDGSVEVLAQGAAEAVGELARWLRHGPPKARVLAVTELEAGAGPEGAPDAAFDVL